MRKIGIGTAILVTVLLTIPLIAILYLGQLLLSLPFVPADVVHWLLRAGMAPWDFMLEWLAGDWTLLLVSSGFFLLLATFVGLLFHFLVGRKHVALDWVDGVAIGALFGTPLLFATLNGGFSPANPLLQAIWLSVLFVAWGIALALAYRRLGGRTAVSPAVVTPLPPEAGEAEERSGAEAEAADAEVRASESAIGRRQFLLRLGAVTAAVTAVSGVAAVTLDDPQRAAARRRTLPVADPDTVAAYNSSFRRFSIARLQPGAADGEVDVLALGTEYPDHHYVALWIGEQSPIVVYENVETALAAYRGESDETGGVIEIIWLDH
jgi:hypothetical protein